MEDDREMQRLAKIRWHCRRGMLELDLILVPFMERELASLTAVQLTLLEQLLTRSDPQLHAYLVEGVQPTEKELQPIVDLIRLHVVHS